MGEKNGGNYITRDDWEGAVVGDWGVIGNAGSYMDIWNGTR